MKQENNSCSGRSAATEASAFLHNAGFETLRTTGSNVFDLIAWKDGQVLFLKVKRSRNAGIMKWTEEVYHLVDLVRTGKIPGEIHFWVCRAGVWYRYKILAGGSVPVEWSS